MSLCGEDVLVEPKAEAWAVTSAWRGDARLFAGIARAALQVVPGKETCFEFVTRRHVEAYGSIQDFIDRVPASTLRSFTSARIRAGDKSLFVECSFGRRRPTEEVPFRSPLGVTVKVTSDDPSRHEIVQNTRTTLARVIERGSITRAKPPIEGPTEEQPDPVKALERASGIRTGVVQILFLLVSLATLVTAYGVFQLVVNRDEVGGFSISFGNFAELLPIAVVIAQAASYPLSTLLFPAIEIADVSPGRRFLSVVGRSGVVSILTAIVGAYAKTWFEGA